MIRVNFPFHKCLVKYFFLFSFYHIKWNEPSLTMMRKVFMNIIANVSMRALYLAIEIFRVFFILIFDLMPFQRIIFCVAAGLSNSLNCNAQKDSNNPHFYPNIQLKPYDFCKYMTNSVLIQKENSFSIRNKTKISLFKCHLKCIQMSSSLVFMLFKFKKVIF